MVDRELIYYGNKYIIVKIYDNGFLKCFRKDNICPKCGSLDVKTECSYEGTSIDYLCECGFMFNVKRKILCPKCKDEVQEAKEHRCKL